MGKEPINFTVILVLGVFVAEQITSKFLFRSDWTLFRSAAALI